MILLICRGVWKRWESDKLQHFNNSGLVVLKKKFNLLWRDNNRPANVLFQRGVGFVTACAMGPFWNNLKLHLKRCNLTFNWNSSYPPLTSQPNCCEYEFQTTGADTFDWDKRQSESNLDWDKLLLVRGVGTVLSTVQYSVLCRQPHMARFTTRGQGGG